ncbi:hypothetical protein EMCRGX_G012554 [Ephydatia muelleri]
MIVVLDHYGLVELGCNGLNIYYHSKHCTKTRYAPVASVVTYSNHCPVHKCNVHWTGDPLTVSVNVVSLPNAPLDLYILMDLSDSMAAPLATVKSISQLIAQQVSSITTNVRIGFGAFNDKPIYPYSPQTPAGCLPGRDAPDCSDRRAGTRQYSFLHLVNFTSSFIVPNVFVTTNLDLPESSFDALVQVLACEQELGWRNRSVEGPERGLQRVVLLITDNQPHLAGDGRLASIYQPNDGKCHVRPYNSSVGYLDTAPGILIYNEDSLFYDYPSVGLVASLLKNLFYGHGGLVLAMGAMWVVVAAVGALVSILLVPVVGLVVVAAVLLLLLVAAGAALLLLLLVVAGAVLLLLVVVAAGAALLLLLAVGAALLLLLIVAF